MSRDRYINKRMVLDCLLTRKYHWRTIVGISKECGLEEQIVKGVLADLINNGKVLYGTKWSQGFIFSLICRYEEMTPRWLKICDAFLGKVSR